MSRCIYCGRGITAGTAHVLCADVEETSMALAGHGVLALDVDYDADDYDDHPDPDEEYRR